MGPHECIVIGIACAIRTPCRFSDKESDLQLTVSCYFRDVSSAAKQAGHVYVRNANHEVGCVGCVLVVSFEILVTFLSQFTESSYNSNQLIDSNLLCFRFISSCISGAILLHWTCFKACRFVRCRSAVLNSVHVAFTHTSRTHVVHVSCRRIHSCDVSVPKLVLQLNRANTNRMHLHSMFDDMFIFEYAFRSDTAHCVWSSVCRKKLTAAERFWNVLKLVYSVQ